MLLNGNENNNASIRSVRIPVAPLDHQVSAIDAHHAQTQQSEVVRTDTYAWVWFIMDFTLWISLSSEASQEWPGSDGIVTHLRLESGGWD